MEREEMDAVLTNNNDEKSVGYVKRLEKPFTPTILLTGSAEKPD